MPERDPFFSIVIVSLNGAGVIARAIDSIRRTQYAGGWEVIVVDNGSTDGLARVVRAGFPEAHLVQSPVNLGFAGGNNLGLREARGDILALLNDDTEVRPDWLQAWADAARAHARWGVLGAKLLYPDGRTIQHAGGVIEPSGNTHHIGYEQPDDGRFDELRDCDHVTGAALAIRREVFERLGPLDEGYFPIYFEETDYCFQTHRIGYEVLYVPRAVVVHHESRTQRRGSFRFHYRYTRNRIRFIVKCFTPREMLRAARHEARWWIHPFSRACYAPWLLAYLHGLVHLPAHLRARRALRRRF